MLSILAVVVSLALLMYFAYRGVTVLLLAPLMGALAVVLSGDARWLLPLYTDTFMSALGGYVLQYLPIFLLARCSGGNTASRKRHSSQGRASSKAASSNTTSKGSPSRPAPACPLEMTREIHALVEFFICAGRQPWAAYMHQCARRVDPIAARPHAARRRLALHNAQHPPCMQVQPGTPSAKRGHRQADCSDQACP